ncbi:substrate-binding domain-containing protein, partial [Vibrio harveyi]|uniref:substrate-binding domain-containing protein n=1 Tax=Vibrio harveyi TaxID=669 RepID=UPI0018F188A6
HEGRRQRQMCIRDRLKSVTFAHDGIALVVNQDNPVTNLTKEQVSKIYHGEITNWKEVGGPDRVMAVVTRENACLLYTSPSPRDLAI